MQELGVRRVEQQSSWVSPLWQRNKRNLEACNKRDPSCTSLKSRIGAFSLSNTFSLNWRVMGIPGGWLFGWHHYQRNPFPRGSPDRRRARSPKHSNKTSCMQPISELARKCSTSFLHFTSMVSQYKPGTWPWLDLHPLCLTSRFESHYKPVRTP